MRTSYGVGLMLGIGAMFVGVLAWFDRKKSPGLISVDALFTPAPLTEISEAQNGQTLQLKKGDLLTLRLSSNASTGYSWSPTKTPDKKILTLSESGYLSDAGVGVPGKEVWGMQAAGPGSTSLELSYVSPVGISSGKTFSVRIDVV
jgi:predicted secreted protein